MTVTKTQILIHGPENSLFLQIQEGTHISLSNPGCNSECSCTVTAESWITQIPGRPVTLKVWSTSRAEAWPSTNGLSWGQQKAEECGLGVEDAQEFSSQTFPPHQMVKLSFCLYSQKCLDCFNWHFPRKEKKKTWRRHLLLLNSAWVGKIRQIEATEKKQKKY